MSEKTFNPIELLKEVAKETTQATQELKGLIQGMETEKRIIEQKRLEFLDNLNIKSIAIFKENEAIANRTVEKLKESVPKSVYVEVEELKKELNNYKKEHEKRYTRKSKD